MIDIWLVDLRLWKIVLSPSQGLEPYPDNIRGQIVDLALDEARTVAARTGGAVYRYEKLFCIRVFSLSTAQGHDLITSPAFVVIKAADEFKDKTTAPNQMWQTDFTYLKVIGWGWFYLVDNSR